MTTIQYTMEFLCLVRTIFSSPALAVFLHTHVSTHVHPLWDLQCHHNRMWMFLGVVLSGNECRRVYVTFLTDWYHWVISPLISPCTSPFECLLVSDRERGLLLLFPLLLKLHECFFIFSWPFIFSSSAMALAMLLPCNSFHHRCDIL